MEQSDSQRVDDDGRPRRVLSIDGGGLKGLFPVALLADLERDLPEPIASYFDLIAGTSTGGIIALGLSLGFSAEKLQEFYERLGPQVFLRPRGSIARWLRPKYDPDPLKNALADQFGERTLAECRTRLLIPSVNLENGEIYIYKTSHHERLQRDYRQKAVDVALATAAAPTYFPGHRDASGLPLADGGVWANNPVGLAAVEAVGLLRWSAVRILSLGCTASPVDTRPTAFSGNGNLYWARRILDVIFEAQSTAAIGMAKHLVGRDNVTRICPMVPPGRYELDKVDAGIVGLAHAEGRKAAPHVKQAFFDAGPTQPFEACRPTRQA